MSRKALAPLLLIVALVLAVGVAIGAKKYIAAKADEAAAKKIQTGPVVVAVHDMPAGSELKSSDLAVLEWPYKNRPPGHFPSVKSLLGRVLHKPVVKAEPILEAKLAPKGMAAGMAAAVRSGMRAVSISASEVIGVAGYLKPGDKVDVIAAVKGTTNSKDPTAKVVLQNVEVLSVERNKESSDKKGKGRVKGQMVTVLINPSDVEKLALATTEGEILMALRNRADQSIAVTPGVRMTSLFSSPTPVAVKVAKQVSKPKPPPAPVVEVIKGVARSRQELKL